MLSSVNCLYTLQNSKREEFLVVRANVRPVVLIQTELPPASVENRGYRGRIQRRRTVVAEVFGLADARTGVAMDLTALAESAAE
jgi:hypothetical protein